MAHMKAIKAKGKIFFYVRKSYRGENKKPTSKNLFSLGQKEKALEILTAWLADPSQKPEILAAYDVEDIKKWLDYVRSK